MDKYEAFKEAYEHFPSQDNEGWVPERGSFKAGFLMGWAAGLENADLTRLREVVRVQQDMLERVCTNSYDGACGYCGERGRIVKLDQHTNGLDIPVCFRCTNAALAKAAEILEAK